MAKITVSPITYNITDANVNIVKIYFTSDVTLTDVKLSIDNGQNFLNNVSMTQTSADFNIANLVNKNYTCLLKGFYEETVIPSHSITNNLTHCTTSNTAKTINANSKFSTTINAEAGFTLNSITVTMGGKDITSSVVNNNVITISSVTGDVVVTAKAIEIVAPTVYSITNNLTNCNTSNSTTSVTKGGSFSTIITARDGYKISAITVTMGGTNITSTALNGNSISISNVTGNIVITANAIQITPSTYTITNNLTNCNNSNSAEIINAKKSYSATITADEGYTMNTITVTMGGKDVTSTVVNNNTITIASVTGNIVITAKAIVVAPSTYTITNNLTNCTTSNNAKTVSANGKYSATITVNAGYVLSTFSVSMGGVDITDSVVNQNTITINSVTGNVIITVKAIEESTKPDIPDVPVVEDELEILPSCTYIDVAEGGNKTIYFKLSNKPTSNTTINISSSSSNLTTSTTQLTFTPENYYIAQSVNITSVGDNNETDDVYTLTISSNGLTSKTITVDVIDSANSNFEVIYDNGTLVEGASLSLNNAVNNGTYISTNQNQDVSVAISNHPLTLNKNDKVHVVLGLGTSEPSSIYSLRSLVLGDGSANNISNSNMINEVQINEALSSDGKVDTYWTIAGNLSNITLTFTCYFARVNIYKIYIERSE